MDLRKASRRTFSAELQAAGDPRGRLRVPDPSEMRYVYQLGLVADRDAIPLAYEPKIFGEERFVLLTNGDIVRMNEEKLSKLLDGRPSP